MRPRTDRHTDAGDHNTFRVVYVSTTHVKCNEAVCHAGQRKETAGYRHCLAPCQDTQSAQIWITHFCGTRRLYGTESS